MTPHPRQTTSFIEPSIHKPNNPFRAGPDDWLPDGPGSAEWGAALRTLLAAEFPEVAALIPDAAAPTLLDASLSTRSTWGDLEGTFDAVHGTVALVGDSAHSMTASIGEGCNCALESAVALDAALGPPCTQDAGPPSPEALSEAFRCYGRERPAAVREVQLRSAAASRK
jgi:2-polyprenyl-6-methoxyphenol hydroxylase-like FAD-dependent oxidoreductase